MYTSSTDEIWTQFDILQHLIAKHDIKQALSLMEVVILFETLKVELEEQSSNNCSQSPVSPGYHKT